MTLREARREDLGAVLALLAEGQVVSRREQTGAAPTPGQMAAFEAIDADPHQQLICAVEDGDVVGTMQLTYLPGLARDGAWRLQIEGMRVRGDRQGRGLGARMIAWAVGQARDRDCALVQLTSDGSRTDAHRFYERLGFEPTHVGFKLRLRQAH